MKKQKAVIFDVYKTLYDIKTDEDDFKTYEFIANWLEHKGIRISSKDLFDLYKKITKEEYESNPEPYPEVEISEVFKKIINGANRTKTKIDEKTLAEEISLLFRILTTKSINIFPDTISVLEQLKKKVRLAIISNAQRLFTIPELVKFDLVRYFETIIFSSDVKIKKPNPKIFLKALDDLKIQPHNAIYVGDNLFDDIGGAKKAGLKTIWVNHVRDTFSVTRNNGYNKSHNRSFSTETTDSAVAQVRPISNVVNHGEPNSFPEKFDLPTPDAEVKIGAYSELTDILSVL